MYGANTLVVVHTDIDCIERAYTSVTILLTDAAITLAMTAASVMSWLQRFSRHVLLMYFMGR